MKPAGIAAAAGVVCLLLIPTFPWAFLPAGLAFLAAFALTRRDRYSLADLREVHDRAEVSDIDPGEVSPDADEVICPGCYEPYPARLPACPRCGRSA